MGRLFLIIAKRIVPVEVFSAHWKALADYRRTPVTPDWIARFAVVLIPAIVFVVMWGTSGSLTAPAALLTGMALLAGGLLSAFIPSKLARSWQALDLQPGRLLRDRLIDRRRQQSTIESWLTPRTLNKVPNTAPLIPLSQYSCKPGIKFCKIVAPTLRIS